MFSPCYVFLCSKRRQIYMDTDSDVLSYAHVCVSSRFCICCFHMVDLIASINYTIQEVKIFFPVVFLKPLLAFLYLLTAVC